MLIKKVFLLATDFCFSRSNCFVNRNNSFSSSLFFGFSRLGIITADDVLHFYNMAFILRLDAPPATNPLFIGKTGPHVFHIKVGASR